MPLDKKTNAPAPKADGSDMAQGTILLTAVQKSVPTPTTDTKKEDR